MFRAVLFDWDGTLADTRSVIVESFQKALSTVGSKTSDEFIERRIGTGAERTFKEILQQSGTPFDDAVVKSLVEKKVQAEIEATGTVRLFEGAIELLESLQGRVKLALASMNNRKVIDHLLTATDTRRFFDVIVAVEEVSRFKPDPEIFLKCASQLNVSSKDCVVVEDSVFGVQAARAAGMGCVAVLTGVYGRAELEKANPGLIVHSLSERERILTFIFR
jgi:HAD superfamily hydrolase (TIGR01509 family)